MELGQEAQGLRAPDSSLGSSLWMQRTGGGLPSKPPLQIRWAQQAQAKNPQVRPGSANPLVGAHSPHSLRGR